jgi:hypothetical protein
LGRTQLTQFWDQLENLFLSNHRRLGRTQLTQFWDQLENLFLSNHRRLGRTQLTQFWDQLEWIIGRWALGLADERLFRGAARIQVS